MVLRGGKMRKFFGLVCAGLFVAGLSSFARAQDLSFGVKAGLNMANHTAPIEGDTYKMKTGVAIGGFAEYAIDDNLAIQPELIYTQKGLEYEYTSGGQIYKYKIKLDYIEIPLLLKYSISPGENVCPFVFAGPALGILMSAKSDSEDIKSICNSTDIGLVLGGGVEFESGVSIDLRYDMGMTKVWDVEGEDYKDKNIVISLMVGYKLPS